MDRSILQTIIECSQDFDLMLMKIDSYTESVGRQLAINYEAARIKVARENGTPEDLEFLREAAESTATEKIRSTISNIHAALVKFFNDMRERILALITKMEVKDALAKIKSKIKHLPLVGKKQVLIEDYAEEAKAADKAISKLTILKSKFKTKQKVTTEEIETIEKEYEQERSKKMGVAGAIKVPLSKAMDLVDKMADHASKLIKKHQDDANTVTKDIQASLEYNDDAHTGQKLISTYASIVKNKIQDFLRCFANIIKSIKNSVKSFFTKKKDEEDDITETAENDISDGANDAEMQKMTKDMEKDMNTNEFGDNDDPITPDPSEEDPADALAVEDPWEQVFATDMTSAAVNKTDLECGTECGVGQECGGTMKENATESFASLYKSMFTFSDPAPSDSAALGSKPNNDAIISDLFKQVMAEVKGHIPEVKQVEGAGKELQATKESAYDSLVAYMRNMV